MKRVVTGCILLALAAVPAIALARRTIPPYPIVKLSIDGERVDFHRPGELEPTPSYLIKGVPMVPVRLFEDKLGLRVDNHLELWKIIQITDRGWVPVLAFKIGDRRALYPEQLAGGALGSGAVDLPVPAQMIRGRLYVPAEVALKQTGRSGTWDAKTRTLSISSKPLWGPSGP